MPSIIIKGDHTKGIGIVSATKLTTYRGCPLAYEIKYIERIKVPATPAAFFGQQIHYILDQFYKKNFKSKRSFLNWAWFYWFGSIDGKFKQKTEVAWSNPIRQKFMFEKYGIKITDEQAKIFANKGLKIITQNVYDYYDINSKTKTHEKRYFNVEFQSKQFRDYGINITLEQALTFAEIGLRIESEAKLYGLLAMKILSKYYDENINNRANVLFHEKRVVKNFEGYKLLAKFDKIQKTKEGDIEIVDYKTGKESPNLGPEIEFVLHHHPQFTQYSKVYREGRNSEFLGLPEESRLLLHHLRSGKTFETKRSNKDYEYLYQLIRTVDRDIKEGNFTPFYGFHCKWCDCLFECNKRRVGVGDGMSAFIERIEVLNEPLTIEDKTVLLETALGEE
ncbi:MAG: PD-(D/E)XK nuclease family protein [Candidatus Pacearchaeota archaeon]|nr:PD-(D/E)XK nuclease family protein [Candidatus Pacearchaeota archaeon]